MCFKRQKYSPDIYKAINKCYYSKSAKTSHSSSQKSVKQSSKEGITIPAAINKAMEENPKLHRHVLEVQPSNYWPELHFINKHFLDRMRFPNM